MKPTYTETTEVFTSPNPDFISTTMFKKEIKKTLKRGFQLDGELKINSNGSFSQKFYKVKNKEKL